MKNKKAQLGEGIVSIPTLLIIVFIMTLFLFVAAGFSIPKVLDPTEKSKPSSISLTQTPILEKVVEIKFQDGSTKKISIYEAIYLGLKNEISEARLYREVIPTFLSEKENCVAVHHTHEQGGIAYELKNGEAVEIEPALLQRQRLKIDYKVNDEVIRVEYYLGPCPWSSQ